MTPKTPLELSAVFQFESTRQRQRAAPLFKEREEFILALLESGMCTVRLRSAGAMLLHVIRIMDMNALRPVDMLEIEEAAQRWVEEKQTRTKNGQTKSKFLFIHISRKWLRFHGVFRAFPRRVEPDDTYLERYVYYLTSVRGFAPLTIQAFRLRVRAFLRWNTAAARAFEDVRLDDVDDYLNGKIAQGFRPRSIFGVCAALKHLFQLAEKEGWNMRKIAFGIRRTRVPKYDRVPKGPEWNDVRRLVDSDFGDSAAAIRGDAMVAISALYAFRASEIVRLMLGDFDWANEILTVTRAKSHKVQHFPIQVEAGEKIIRYLKQARPKCACRNLFVTLKPPYRAIDPTSLWLVISGRLKSLGIVSRNWGAHAIRHSCATRLLHEGTPLPDIARFLGHSNLDSVSIYARHDIESLRQVAAISLEGVL